MNDADLRQKLLSVHPPDELEAERRSWRVVRAAWEAREPLPADRHRRRLVAAALFAAAAILGAVALTPGRRRGRRLDQGYRHRSPRRTPRARLVASARKPARCLGARPLGRLFGRLEAPAW